jgi:hypothetical protein
MRFMAIAFLSALCFGSAVETTEAFSAQGGSSGQPGAAPSLDEVREWFLKARHEASKPIEPLGAIHVRIRTEHPPTVDAATLRAWREEVAGKPQHPLRREIEIMERRLARPDVSVQTFWYIAADRWRVSRDLNYTADGRDGTHFFDAGARGTRRWELRPESLRLYDGLTSPATLQAHEEINRGLIEQSLRLFFYSCLDFGTRSADLDGLQFHVDGHRWRASLANDRGWRWTYEGTWHAESKQGLVLRAEEHRPEQTEPSAIYNFSGHTTDPALRRLIPHKVDHYSAVLNTTREITWLGSATGDRQVIERVATGPWIPTGHRGTEYREVDDPLRGAIRLARLHDYRGGRVRRTDYTQDGLAETVFLERPSPPRKVQRLRVAGWVAMGVLVSGFILFRILKHRTS